MFIVDVGKLKSSRWRYKYIHFVAEVELDFSKLPPGAEGGISCPYVVSAMLYLALSE